MVSTYNIIKLAQKISIPYGNNKWFITRDTFILVIESWFRGKKK